MSKTMTQALVVPEALVDLLPPGFLAQPPEFVWLDLEAQAQTGWRSVLRPLVPSSRVKSDLKTIWQWLEGIQETVNGHVVLKHKVLVLIGTLPDRTNTADCWALERVNFLIRDLQHRGLPIGFCLVDINGTQPVLKLKATFWQRLRGRR